MDSITITLPYPPSVNHYWGRRGMRQYVTRKGTRYRENVIAVVWSEGKRKQLTDRLAVEVLVYTPDARERDLDNIEKALWDALQHAGMFLRDSQIDEKHVYRQGIDRVNPRVEITITPIGD